MQGKTINHVAVSISSMDNVDPTILKTFKKFLIFLKVLIA